MTLNPDHDAADLAAGPTPPDGVDPVLGSVDGTTESDRHDAIRNGTEGVSADEPASGDPTGPKPLLVESLDFLDDSPASDSSDTGMTEGHADDEVTATASADSDRSDVDPAESEAVVPESSSDGEADGKADGEAVALSGPDPEDTAVDPATLPSPLSTLPPPAGSAAAPKAPVAAAPAQAVPPRLARLDTNVRRWADAHGVADDPYLTALGDAILHQNALTAFASVSPLDYLPMPENTAGRVWSMLGRLTAVMRNVLVFVPVLLTWWAISEATSSYGEYLDAVDADRQATLEAGESVGERTINFLEFWESGGTGQELDGFSPLAGHWRITHIATLDAAIIAVVIALTFLVGILESRASARRAKAERLIERERIRIALAIMEGLEGNRSIDTETLEESLAFALGDLGQAARDVQRAAERLENASVGMDALAPRVVALTTEIERLSQRFSSDVQLSIQNLTDAVGALGSTLEGDMQRFMADVLAGLEEVVDRLKTTSVGVEFGTKQLRDDLDAIHQRLATIVR